MSDPARSTWIGSRPSVLRVEWRADGRLRLRVETPGYHDGVIDLDPEDRRSLMATLTAGPPSDQPPPR